MLRVSGGLSVTNSSLYEGVERIAAMAPRAGFPSELWLVSISPSSGFSASLHGGVFCNHRRLAFMKSCRRH